MEIVQNNHDNIKEYQTWNPPPTKKINQTKLEFSPIFMSFLVIR
jgi:hypothetical protein